MREVKMWLKLCWALFTLMGLFDCAIGGLDDQAKIFATNGHIIFESAQDKNITFYMKGSGHLNIGGISVDQMLPTLSKMLVDGRPGPDGQAFLPGGNVAEQVQLLAAYVSGPFGLIKRVVALEQQSSSSNATQTPPRIGALARRVKAVETKLAALMTSLLVNRCASGPCQNGGTCLSSYDAFQCLCPSNWEGPTCNVDVNECARFAGTELGCQNGATCHNTHGGYTCMCQDGWRGIHCTSRSQDCSTAGSDLCGHGTCVQAKDGYRCICDQGWKTNGLTQACTTDVDECSESRPHCSKDPEVSCINLPGSFVCGACPAGYTGNGFYCVDVNECETNNGGCSTSPSVTCINTRNGGTCFKIDAQNYSCTCPPGTKPPNCMRTVSPCESNPCMNGGTCSPFLNRYVCRCPAAFTGPRCQTNTRTCGQILNQLSGELRYPQFNGTYNHNARCAWLIKTNDTQVLNVTFTQFNLENPGISGECKFDWLQIHDGRTSAAQIIGRFCGRTLPHGGNIISTHNMLYLWFRSDNSTAHDGFALNWESIDPVCGFTKTVVSHGIISSPGTPGNYPPNRDCKWFLEAPQGRRLQFTFFTMKIEAHENCNYDFLQITDGLEDEGPLLAKYCNTSHPEPLITPSNKATVYFHSDENGNDAGFQISYAVVEGVPGCGGTYTQPEGTIASPLSQTDHLYPNNLNCEYLIKLPVGSRVDIRFTRFHLEQSESCKFDYLEIFDGRSTEDTSLGKFCGDRMPAPYTSTGSTLLLKFHTDWSSPHPGFSLTYKVKCGGTFTEPGTELVSPSYPQLYTANQLCDYAIQAPLGKAIAFDFLDFDIEKNSYPQCELDYVELYDGPLPTNATLLGRYCSTKPPPRTISSKNVLLLRFVSDGSISGRGFKGNFSFFDVSCGGVLTREDIIIRSPAIAESGKYQHDAQCEWIIVAPVGHAIQLTWNSFELELSANCVYDYVQVFDNSSMADSLVGRYCGSEKPPAITSSGNMLTIRFVTDSSSSKDGFAVAFTFIDVEKSCGGNYFATSGIIKSPGWPKNYLSNKVCEWVITVPMGQQIMLLVRNFTMEKHKSCRFDGLTVRNGGSSSAPLIGTFCGEDNFNGTISFSHQLYLRFFSDSSRNYAGFLLEWDSASTGCGGVLTSPRGSIISPNYPLPYGQNAMCVWRISTSLGSAIHIVFTDLDMESHKNCLYDYLDIYDGFDMSGRKLGRFCTSDTDPLVLNTESNHAYIRMRTDDTNQRRGFQLKYNILCRRNITGYGGFIESPNFPNEYPSSADCRWTITVPPGNRINLEFSHFDFESIGQLVSAENTTQRCPFDYLELQEMGAGDLPMTRRYCANKPSPMVSIGRTIDLIFHTDSSGEQMGFRAEWSINGCGGELTKPYGVLSSPNYPNQYPKLTECHWTITTEPETVINLVVEDFLMETGDECRFDGLRVASDANFTHVLATLCHEQKEPVSIVSSGNQLFVKFYSDTTFTYKGFRARYTTSNQKCGGRIMNHEGFLSSPNYPKNYPTNASCSWIIKTDMSHTLQFTLNDWAIQKSDNCTSDALMVYDGNVRAIDKLLLKLCGSGDTATVRTTGNELLVTFQSDGIYEAKGFRANYATNCGSRIVVNAPGTITLNKAHKMSSDNCTWVLVAPEQTQRITLTIVHQSIFDSDGDCLASLSVFEGETTDGPLRLENCGHKIPPAIVSRGNALTVLISSEDLYLQKIDNLFIEIAYTTLDNACGGRLTALAGEFASPNYPDTYPLKVECVWELIASPGNKLSLLIKELDIEPSDGCNGDYLEIREKNGGGKLLGDFCGKQIPLNLTEASSFWVKFRSNELGVAKGFLAEYSYDTLSELTGSSGTITSPMFPRGYTRSENMGWRITVDIGSVITINFNRFAVDRHTNDPFMCDGTLTIYDGYDETAVTLLTTCGYIKPKPVVSTTNVVYIVLDHSDVIDSSTFSLSWQQKAVSEATEIAVDDEFFCGGHATVLLNRTDEVFNLSSPGYPRGYQNGLNCSWILQSAVPTYHPFLNFDFIDLDETDSCLTDYIEVFSSSDLFTWKSFGRICTYNFRDKRSFEGTPYLKVEFNTDYYLNRTGFVGSVSLLCGGVLTEPNGVITQPNKTSALSELPSRLHSMMSCMWNISVRAGRTIEFSFDQLNISLPGATLLNREGFVAIRNGIDEHSPLLGRYIGTAIPSSIQTGSNRAFVQFTPNRIQGPNTFRLLYREVSVECGGNVVLNSQYTKTEVMSPNYPDVPPPHSECFWSFLAPAGELLQAQFVEVSFFGHVADCKNEYIQLREGLTEAAPELLHSCSADLTKQIMTRTNALSLKYFNGRTNNNGRFKLQVSLAKCGGTVRGARGTISSKNYPLLGGYPSATACEYYIQEGLHGTLSLTFADLHLPNSVNCSANDNVKIYTLFPGPNATMLELGSFCGTTIPKQPIVSLLPRVKIVFTSFKPNAVWRGFQLNFALNYSRCSKAIEADSGEITSPGYGEELQPSAFCEWRITVPDGRRIKIEFLDLNIASAAGAPFWSQRLSFFDGASYNARIKMITTSAGSVDPILSSANKMLVQYLSRAGSGSRGFRLRFSSDLPSICVGNLNGLEGRIESPVNVSTVVCTYSRTQGRLTNDPLRPNVGTLAMNFVEVFAGPMTRMCIDISHRAAPGVVGTVLLKRFCQNATQELVLSPFHDTAISVVQNYVGFPQSFKMDYRVHQCGGSFTTVGNISRPQGTFGEQPLHCAWVVTYPDQTLIDISFERFDPQLACDMEYLIVYNGPTPLSPQLGRYCKDMRPEAGSISTQKHLLFVEYHTKLYSRSGDFELRLSTKTFGCGGTLHAGMPRFGSPLDKGKYRPREECVWLLRANAGQHIGISFVDRFNLEKSPNCTKDYVELFDRRPDGWVSLGRVCGKETPPSFNSTGTDMKVIFRTDDSIELDGFTINWESNCGGIFYASHETNIIVSPNYPDKYNNLQVCNYTFLANKTDGGIEFNFLDFVLEDMMATSVCAYDNLTVYRKLEFAEPLTWEKMGTYCMKNPPGRLRVQDRASIVFRTDRYIQARGFKFEYRLDTCGGNITATSLIRSPEQLPPDGTYRPALVCRWYITIPPGKKVTVRFETLEVEHTELCYFDTVEVFRGLEPKQEQRLALLCGNLTAQAPPIAITGSHGLITFKAESFTSSAAKMSAMILYTPDCDQHHKLDERTPWYTFNVLGSDNAHVMDCQYTFQAPSGYTLQATFSQFHVGTARNVTDCSDNFVELRDGASVFAELIGRFCGNEPVAPQTTFGSALHFRYKTDSMLKGTLFEANVSLVPSLCGAMQHNLTGGLLVTLSTPNFGGANRYPPNTKCMWELEVGAGKNIEIQFEQMDLQAYDESGGKCRDYLGIRDASLKSVIYEGLGSTLIFNGGSASKTSFYQGTRYPNAYHIYCGSGNLPSTYVSITNRVYVKFESDFSIEGRGVALRIHESSRCAKNYTALQGRLVQNEMAKNETCTITVEVPQNYTIALYFNSFYLYNVECDKHAIKVYDGPGDDRLLGKYCNFVTPDPIFTVSNVLRVVLPPTDRDYVSLLLDATYLATDQGQGCGGELFNYGGVFSSPLYPANNRSRMECLWTVSVPANLVVALRFEVFDLGSKSSCATDFLQILDAEEAADGGIPQTGKLKKVAREHCGGDKPANYISNNSVVQVRYIKTFNFAGIGWMIKFMGIEKGTAVHDY
uniref:Uncharacterized protein n=1 Tax=Anopheles atroparvus TaxID=41427 RepID=A0A182INM1_ANOAO